MTRAIVFCGEAARSGAGPAIDGQTVLDRLRAQLDRLGVADIRFVARPAVAAQLCEAGLAAEPSQDVAGDLAIVCEAAATAGEPLVLCEGDLVAHDSALAAAVAEGVRASTALVGPRRQLDLHTPVLRQRGRIISVGSTYHRVSAANCSLRGLVKVTEPDLAALADAGTALVAFSASAGVELDALAGRTGTVGLLVLALVRAGTPVVGHRVRKLCCGRATDAEAFAFVSRALRETDEHAVQLRLAVKEQDDLFATYGVSWYSPRIVRLAARLGLAPTAVTWISIGLATGAAVAFASGARVGLVLGAVLLYLGFVFDCVDGQLARYTHHYSRYGGWLDAVGDRGKEYLVYAGLAVGAVRGGIGDVWALAIAALVLQTVRHMTDVWYSALQDEAVGRLPRVPLAQPGDGLSAGSGGGTRRLVNRLGGTLGRISARLESNRASPGYWFKRTIVFPIGERWLVIALAAAIGGPRVALIALLCWGGLAALYTLTGRGLRARSMRIPAMPAHGIALHRDDGPVARALGRVGAGRPSPLPAALLGAAIAAGLLALAVAGPGRSRVDLTREWPLVLAALAVLLAGTAGRHPHNGPLDWLVAAALRGAELLFVVLVGRNDRVPTPVVFGLLAIVVLYHYDLAARLDTGTSPVRGRWLNFGWDGRVTLLAVAATFGAGEFAMAGLAGYLAVVFLAGSVLGLVSTGSPVPAGSVGSASTGSAPRPRSGAALPDLPGMPGLPAGLAHAGAADYRRGDE
jgi:phosphatidylglycerophosphate synthase